MTIRFFSQSDTHREFSNFAPFDIELDEAWLGEPNGIPEQPELVTVRHNAPECVRGCRSRQ